MPCVKIKHSSPNGERKSKLFRILSEDIIYATKINITSDGLVILKDDDEVDRIFSKKTEKLQKEEFTSVTPPEVKTKRTVIYIWPTRKR